ncbi:hypothetical protein WB66_03200 [bacteria symbiont BFo1 of Frankliniella occidentalis]|nr:hypothetical protein WB66_03200 [bacteria symbiont BFo1 of Frankliniella occidentalis]
MPGICQRSAAEPGKNQVTRIYPLLPAGEIDQKLTSDKITDLLKRYINKPRVITVPPRIID